MDTWVSTLFYLMSLSQIFLISSYLPKKMLARMTFVLETYPPEVYPKLYPNPIETYRIGLWAFKAINQLIFLLGFIVLFVMTTVVDHSTFADDGFISEAWPAGYGMIQFIPILLLEFFGLKQFKLMREVNSEKYRKAELRPRRFLDFVSPAVFGLTLLFYFTAVFLDLHLHDFILRWDHDTLQRISWMTFGNVFMAAAGIWNLHGRKLDPHQDLGDRTNQIAAHLRSSLYVSMAASAFFMTAAADDVFDLDFLDATLMSLYFQVVVLVSIGHLLRSLKLEDINFDVYKKETAAA